MSDAPVLRCALALLAATFLMTPSLLAQTAATPAGTVSVHAAMERALSSRVTLSLADLTIQELAAQLRTRFHINVMIDRRGLDDVGLGSDTRLEGIECSEVVLEEALELLLGQLDLSFFVRSDVLILSTPEEAENHLETVVYPVADLVATLPRDPFGKHREYLDFDTLIETITSAVAPDTWDEVGGAGAIEAFPASRSLVISQVRHVHREIRALLANLRQSRTMQQVQDNVVTPNAVSEARLPRANSNHGVLPRRVYQPSGAWSIPRKHD